MHRMVAHMGDSHDFPDSLRYAAPATGLRKHCSLLFAWYEPPGGFDAWMPTVDAQIVIRVGGNARLETIEGRCIDLPRTALVGPLAATTRLVTSADYRAYGAALTPGGLRAITGCAAHELVDRSVDLGVLVGAADLAPILAHAEADPLPARTWTAIEGMLARRIAGHTHSDWRTDAIDHWLRASINPSLDRLQAMLGLSARQVGRICGDAYGIPPRLLALRRRTQVAAEYFAIVDPDPNAIAFFGFSDQSHFIRNFRRFIGTTPRRFVEEDAASRYTFTGPRDVGASLI
jgi:AraC-like DNA-binding protein